MPRRQKSRGTESSTKGPDESIIMNNFSEISALADSTIRNSELGWLDDTLYHEKLINEAIS